MRRVLLLALFVVLPVDFAVADVRLTQAGARAVEWDDEEESVPSRRQRAGVGQRSVEAVPRGPRSLAPARAQRWAAPADRRADPTASWLVPLRRAHLPSVRSASPSEDH